MRDKKNDVAVLGLGRMGETHVRAAKASPFVGRVYGVEPDPVRCSQRAGELGIVGARLEDILLNPAVRLVCIASVNSAHAAQAAMALRAGKAVLCEKPMGESLEEAEHLLAAQQETKGFLQIGFELRYSTLYRTAKDWVDGALIGVPVNSHVRYYCSEFHRKNTWRSLSSGSLIGEKLSHYLDLQRWYIGRPVVEVFAMSAPNAVEYFRHPDNHQISMRFDGGGISQLNFVMHLAETDSGDPLLDMLEKQADDGHCLQTYIFGTRGAIEMDVFRRRIRRWAFTDGPRQLESRIAEIITFPKEKDSIWFHNVHGQVLRVAELVACGLPPDNPAADAFETMKAGFAAETSMREGRAVRLSNRPSESDRG